MTMTQRVGTWVAATVLSVTGATVAATQEPSRASTAIAEAAKPAGGVNQGIKVHGRWTIDVRNPDGSLAARHEFNNAIAPGGRGLLAGLLGRYYPRVSRWYIRLAPSVQDMCAGELGCAMEEFLGTGTAPENSLRVDVPYSKGGPAGDLALIGTLRFVGSGAIRAVATSMSVCVDTSCADVTVLHDLTLHELDTPISVAAGQIVQVTVQISFS